MEIFSILSMSGHGSRMADPLIKMDADSIWRALCRFWINVFVGAPDYIHTDTESTFDLSVFKDRAAEHGNIVRIAPTEAHDHIGVIERSHAYLRTVYENLCVDVPSKSKEDRLSLSFRALNDTPNSYTRICRTTLAYGNFPKIPEIQLVQR